MGGAFLVYLGATALLHVRAALRADDRRSQAVAATTPDDTAPEAADGTASSVAVAVRVPVVAPTLTRLPVVFRTGIISSLTNPKTGLFFLALLRAVPARGPDSSTTCLLATVAACMFVYGVPLSVIARRVGRFSRRAADRWSSTWPEGCSSSWASRSSSSEEQSSSAESQPEPNVSPNGASVRPHGSHPSRARTTPSVRG